MKWIGQHIWDFVSRFRSDVYLEDLTESTQGHVVGVDANGKLYKQDVSTGDITSVVAGDALTGGGTAGDVTINHEDTSTQASVNNSGTTYIQDITLDTYGHVTGLTSTDVFNTAQQPVYIRAVRINHATVNSIHTTPQVLVASVPGKTIIPLTIAALSDRNVNNTNSRANFNFGYYINSSTVFGFTTNMIAQMRRFAYNQSTDYYALTSPGGMRAFTSSPANKPIGVSGEPGQAFTPNCFSTVDFFITYTLI